MIQQELEQLELPLGQAYLVALVADDATGRVHPEPLQLPDPSVPEVQAHLVSLHLEIDDLEIGGRCLLGGWPQVGDVALHPGQDPPLELEEIRVDADPVTGVFPALGVEILALERSRCPRPDGSLRGSHFFLSPRSTTWQLLR